jgi:hypothetical protein
MLPNPRGGNAAGKVREKQACPALPVIAGTGNPAVNTLPYTDRTAKHAVNALPYTDRTAKHAVNALPYTDRTANPAGFIKIKSPALAKKRNYIINILN